MIYTCRSFPADLLAGYPVLPRKQGKRVGKNRRKYLNVVCAFDIETTRLNEDQTVMYIWQLQIGTEWTIIGRCWNEFRIAIKRLIRDLPEDIYICVYVHNLAYEFQFLRGIYKFKENEVFAVKPRRPLRADMYGHIELRCSYLHSNMRLETYLNKMGVPDQKLEYDYDKPRYPWTPLTSSELEYCVHDVKGLVEALCVEMAHDGDTLYTIPATSTGYVRRDVKAAMRQLKYGVVQDMLPDLDTYDLLREAFRGGNTHANRYFSGQIVKDVYSFDRSSSYPDVQVNCKFPIGPFRRVQLEKIPWEKLEDLMYRRGKACLIRIAFWDVRLSDPYSTGAPYLAYDKCRFVKNVRLDNGRILSADYLETTLTDIDLKIVLDQYSFSARRILTLEYARYGDLPQILKDVIVKYYRLKTELKGVADQALLYEKSKNKLNSIYGMSAQNPVKQNIIYSGGEWKLDNTPVAELLEKANKKAFFPYQWGIWTTAWARYRLQEGIDLVRDQGGEFIYCDTDSVKYTGSVDWSSYNAKRQADSTANGAYADDKNGVRHFMGVYEPEKGYPARFATRGAKKYVVDHNGKLEATIAGVGKREDNGRVSGGMELEEMGGLEAFLKDEVIFRKAGGIELSYNDDKTEIVKIDGHRLKIRSCVTINPSTYTLTDTEEYYKLITSREIREYFFDVYGIGRR